MKLFFSSISIYIFIFFLFGIIITGCSPAPLFIRQDFEQKQIRTIAIMPVTDKRNTAEGKVPSQESISNIEKLLSEKIADKNYDIISPGSVKNIIKAKAIENMSPDNLCSILKVDGILYSELFDGYAIIDGIVNEISISIGRGLKSIPDGKGNGKELLNEKNMPVADNKEKIQ